jgi:hypothetical protein
MIRLNVTELRDLLKRMGFGEHEIPLFFTDISRYITQKGCRSKMELNTEMESLGWGIGVIDETIFNLIKSLINETIYPHQYRI